MQTSYDYHDNTDRDAALCQINNEVRSLLLAGGNIQLLHTQGENLSTYSLIFGLVDIVHMNHLIFKPLSHKATVHCR